MKSNKFILRPEDIINLVCKEYKVTFEELKNNAKNQNINISRQITIHLIKEILNLSYKEIADIFDKSILFILFAHECIKEKIKTNNSLKNKIEDLKNFLEY